MVIYIDSFADYIRFYTYRAGEIVHTYKLSGIGDWPLNVSHFDFDAKLLLF